MTSPSVAYAYADGSTNTVRARSTTYPNGRVLDYGYGSSGSVADQLSRIATLTHNGSQVAAYTYLGLSSFVRTDYTQPSVRWDLITGSGANPYAGLDAFGRVIDCLWNKYSSTAADLERVKYGYDLAGNRTWRYNSVADTNGANFDELYSYDGLYQLAEMQRGSFSGTPPAGFGSQAFEQAWTLDPTGNWRGFQEKAAGTSVTLNQTRTANTVNEITGISNSVGGSWVQPAYDGAGNMTTMPQPAAPASGYTATYDAWNRLVKLVDTATGQTVQENAYDGLTRRTIQKSFTSGTLSETRHYYYSDNWQVLEERLGTSPDTATADRQFVWGQRYIDDLVLRDRSTTGTLDERLYALQDANWNVTALCDTSAAVQERNTYSAYGMPMFLTPSFGSHSASFGWETLYGGYRYDLATGIYYIRYRDLHPLLGTWISRDRLGYNHSSNLAEYNNCQPLIYVDTWGLAPCNNTCGPDVTAWFIADLANHVKIAKETQKLTTSTNRLRAFGFQAAVLMSYKWLTFDAWSNAQKRGECGTGNCVNTVMLAGICLRKNVLGNIAFGYIASLFPPGDLIVGLNTPQKVVTYAYENVVAMPGRLDDLAAFGVGNALAARVGKTEESISAEANGT